MALTTLAGARCRAADAGNMLHIEFFSIGGRHAPPAAMLAPPLQDEALLGARLAVTDNATTGKFLNQGFALDERAAPDAPALLAAFDKSLQVGRRLFVTDVPAPLLLQLADRPGAAGALLLDATTRDDALRNADCRANVVHLAPSRAMLADALMQYLVTKNWRRIMLLSGATQADRLYADAIRRAATKFQLTLAADRPWSFNPAAQQADTGHYQVNDEVGKATQGPSYDVLVVADEAGNFGNDLSYRTSLPRPVAGTQGLVPAGWSPVMDEYASTQLQLRFKRSVGRVMTERDYSGWLAVRSIGEAATRVGSLDQAALIKYLRGPDFAMSGYKGPPLSFRPWDGQLRQPVLLGDATSLVSLSPQPGFLHQVNTLDTLGTDQPETACHKR